VDSVSGVGVLDKAVTILEALLDRGPSSLAELVTATGLSRPTVHRLATALETHGLVGRDADGRFRAGVRLLAWGSQAADGIALLDSARPILTRLRDATGESAQLFVRDGNHRVCVAAVERPSGLRDTVPIGVPLPLDRGSGGKVLLAFAPPSGSDPELSPELQKVRRRGWAASAGEREPGVASVSAPVLDRGQVVAAIGVSGPIERVGREPGRRYAAAVVDAARELEAHTGLTAL
jgi:DNA-binding IclR family transcriptional regulator